MSRDGMGWDGGISEWVRVPCEWFYTMVFQMLKWIRSPATVGGPSRGHS
jgi:hypothetical protein